MLGGMPAKILIDCDPGHDDAVAIILAAHAADLIGITTVHGNASLERTTMNARIVRDLLDLDVPVHSGAARPLVVEPKFAAFVHGESGLDGADLPPPTRPLDGMDAARFIVDTVRASDEPIWLVPVGPLTNIALALRTAPDIVDRVAGISLMGGGTYGNRTPAAEFNIWADPHAAAIVCGSGAPIKMLTIDLTHQFILDPVRIADIAALNGRLARVLTGLFEFFSDNYISRHHHLRGAPLHDPCAVLAVTHPEWFTGTERHVGIETDGHLTIGQTIIDRRNMLDGEPPNCFVPDQIDDVAAWQRIVAAIEHFS